MEDIHSHGLAYKRRELAAMMAGESPPRAFGMLMFSCNGRGTNLYDEPSFDSRTLTSYVPVPCCGFMCNGKLARRVEEEDSLFTFTSVGLGRRRGCNVNMQFESGQSGGSRLQPYLLVPCFALSH